MEILEWYVQLGSIVLLEWPPVGVTCQRYGKPVCVLPTKTCIKTSLSKPVYHKVLCIFNSVTFRHVAFYSSLFSGYKSIEGV